MTKIIGDSALLDTWAATGTQSEPSEGKKNSGWADGERPAYDFMNFIQAEFGEKLNHILANGVPAWNATTAYGANVFSSRAGVIYRSLSANRDSQPPSVNWSPIITEATLAVAGAVRLSSNAETQTGTATDRAVTPSSLSSRTATESRTGLAAEATQANVNAGTGGSVFVTPAKMRFGFSVSLTSSGYILFPTWLGGLIIQWGSVNVSADTNLVVAYPLAFPSAVLSVQITEVLDNLGTYNLVRLKSDPSTTNFVVQNANDIAEKAYWMAIGK